MRKLVGLFALSLLVGLAGCKEEKREVQPAFSAQQSENGKNYVFAIHPLHNPERLLERYGPIIDYLNRHIKGAHFTLEASRNYEEFDKKLYAGKPDFALPNPYQTVNSLKHGYHVFGKMGDDENFRGIILVRRDSGIAKVSDLKGKKVSYPAMTALAATMMPQYYLHTHGLDVNRDIENLYVGSQESSIMNVYLGQVAAAATWPVPWLAFQKEHPDKAAQLELKWQTEPLINNGLVARSDVPPELVGQVATLLATLHESAEGRAMLEQLPISRFERANDASYDVVRSFLDTFSRTVRPLEP
ncbi:MAG TPA: phosphate/phosphite/phosphonate ABC transporter substrate-binding protein [Gallionella sp.]|nr:phosphate/phosphite/phosphonate ABC transporter substrate-binding protein [Gallionella sp.]